MSAEQIQQLFLKHENPYTKQLFKIDELPTCTFDETMEKLTLVFPFPKGQSDIFQTFQRNVLKCLKIDHRIPSVKILYAEVRIDEEAETDSPGLNPKDTLSRIQQLASPHFIGIVSGKGGVGKSQTTVNLAKALQKQGEKVAIIDADIYGASIQKILNNNDKATATDQTVFPVTIDGIEVISSHMFTPNNEPIVWRGPMLGKLLAHFFNDVLWSSDNTYYLIDLPPGTGDIPLDLQHLVPHLEIIVITTPNNDATFIAAKSGFMAQNLNQHIIGIIENMAYFIGDDGTRYYIFGKGGGAQIAMQLNVPLLAQIPIINQDKPIDTSHYFDHIIASIV